MSVELEEQRTARFRRISHGEFVAQNVSFELFSLLDLLSTLLFLLVELPLPK